MHTSSKKLTWARARTKRDKKLHREFCSTLIIPCCAPYLNLNLAPALLQLQTLILRARTRKTRTYIRTSELSWYVSMVTIIAGAIYIQLGQDLQALLSPPQESRHADRVVGLFMLIMADHSRHAVYSPRPSSPQYIENFP